MKYKLFTTLERAYELCSTVPKIGEIELSHQFGDMGYVVVYEAFSLRTKTSFSHNFLLYKEDETVVVELKTLGSASGLLQMDSYGVGQSGKKRFIKYLESLDVRYEKIPKPKEDSGF